MTVVFICVGAAKAGTSWLHRQLSAHPECHFRTIKELHYFDALDAGRLNRELTKHQEQQAKALSGLAASSRRPNDTLADKLTDRANWLDVLEARVEDKAAYLRYLSAGAGDAKVIGEMTPAYALLSENRLRDISQMSSDVRLLYLLRDPVDRLWSHIRMIAGRRDSDGVVNARRCDNILSRVLSGEESQIVDRSDYASSIAKLISAVPGGQLLLEFFEDMVQGPGLERICKFLGVAPIERDLMPVHVGQPLAMSPEQRRAAEAWLAPQYDAVEKAIGRLPEAWQRRG